MTDNSPENLDELPCGCRMYTVGHDLIFEPHSEDCPYYAHLLKEAEEREVPVSRIDMAEESTMENTPSNIPATTEEIWAAVLFAGRTMAAGQNGVLNEEMLRGFFDRWLLTVKAEALREAVARADILTTQSYSPGDGFTWSLRSEWLESEATRLEYEARE